MESASVPCMPVEEKKETIEVQDPIAQKLENQSPVNNERLIAATDIDDTWLLSIKDIDISQVPQMLKLVQKYVGIDEATISSIMTALEEQNKPNLIKIFNDIYRQATETVRARLEKDNIPVIAVTGRDLDLVLKDQRLYSDGKPHFDGIFTAVGTEFYIAQKNSDGTVTYVEDPAWTEKMKEKNFNNEAITHACEEILHELTVPGSDKTRWNLTLSDRYRGHNKEAWQKHITEGTERPTTPPPEKYKISMYCDYESPDQAEELRHLLKSKLDAINYKGEVVISHDPKYGRYNIDIVAVNKADAVNFLNEKYGAKHNARTMYAENSENGQAALLNLGGVMVGGSTEGLKRAVEAQPKTWESHILAEEDKDKSMFHVYGEPEDQKIIFKGSSVDDGPISLLRALRAWRIWGAVSESKTNMEQPGGTVQATATTSIEGIKQRLKSYAE